MTLKNMVALDSSSRRLSSLMASNKQIPPFMSKQQLNWTRYELLTSHKDIPIRWRRIASERVGTSAKDEKEAIAKLKQAAKERKAFDANLADFIDMGKPLTFRIAKCECSWEGEEF